MKKMSQTVFVGLSGGVDSSVAALKLIEAGYSVVGVFIKTWQPDFIDCNWEAERLDAMRVAAKLDIPFLTCDAEKSYRDEVGEYMVREYQAGRTPNPDVMCNKFVKFKTFLDFATAHGADKIATGHYAQVVERDGVFQLYRGKDANKDQSYFLWTLSQEQLSKTLFPIGTHTKSDVRTCAKKAGLLTADKVDSQGVCFLGEIDMKDFLSHYTDAQKGTVIDTQGNEVGTHDGALFYTLGQRHGFVVHTKETTSGPWYVCAKDLGANTITVSEEPPLLTSEKISICNVNLIGNEVPESCSAQFRYRQKPFRVNVEEREKSTLALSVSDEGIEIPSPGQSCVLYDGNRCLGGGTIDSVL